MTPQEARQRLEQYLERQYLNKWPHRVVLPINDAVIDKRITDTGFEDYTFVGLIKIAYGLK